MKKFLSKYSIQICLVISGLLTALTVVFPKAGIFQWISLMPGAYALFSVAENREKKLRTVYTYGMVFFMSYYLVIYHWFLYMYPMSFMDMERSVALVIVLVAWIGLSIFQTLSSALIFVVFALVYRCRVFERIRIFAPFFLACLWATIEWTQTIGWWGVPWGRLCLGQTELTTNLMSASIFGSYFVSFLIVAVNACGAYMVLHMEKKKILAVCMAVMLVGNFAVGIILKTVYNNEGNEKKTFAIVQGSVSLDEKWHGGSSSMQAAIEKVHTELTMKAGEEGADVVVWAETAFPYDMTPSRAQYFSELAKSADVTIIASSFTQPETPIYTDSGKTRSYNSIFEVRKDGTIGEREYHKQRLVPFAEFVPLYELISFVLPPLASLNQMSDDILAGEESTVLDTEVGKIGGAICFDSVYENISLEAVRGGAQVIVVATNDAWFDDSAENYMHTSQSKLRAIETGRYIVRAANTGISGIINPFGEFEERHGIDEQGLVMGEVYLRDQITPYTVIGNLFAYICLGLSVIGFVTATVYCFIERRKRGKA